MMTSKLKDNLNREIDARLATVILLSLLLAIIFGFYGVRGLYYQLTHKDYYQTRIETLKSVLHPGDGKTAVELAMVMYLDGDRNKAIALARQVYKDEPEDKKVLLYLGLMLSDSGADQEAVDILSVASAKFPGYQRDKTLFYLGQSQYNLGKYDDAVKTLSACIQYNPGMSSALLYLGKSKEKTGDVPGAINAYQLLLKTDPGDEQALEAIKELEGR